MSLPVLNREQVRELDRRAIEDYGIPGIVLMENAGRGCVDTLCEIGISGPVVICCGGGNNAGDGFVMARHLDLRGKEVKVLMWSDPDRLTGDAATNYQILAKTDVPIVVLTAGSEPDELAREFSNADWIVDALLGTGTRGDPRPPLDQVIELANAASCKKLAVDLPSGMDCDTGHPAAPTFRADHTCTFVAAKPGLLAEAARPYVGQLHVLDIGAPGKLIDEVKAG